LVGKRCRGCKAKKCIGPSCRYWIQGAIKRPGSLTKYAMRHRMMTQRNTIDLNRLERYVKREETGKTRTWRLQQINAARNLRGLR